jgi:hypothetical protein
VITGRNIGICFGIFVLEHRRWTELVKDNVQWRVLISAMLELWLILSNI